LAKAAGEAELASLKDGGAPAGFSAPEKISRPKIAQSGRLDMAPVMKADATKLPAYVGVERPGEGYVIYRVTNVIIPEKVDPRMEEAMNRQMQGTNSALELFSYIEYLRKMAGVEFLIKKPGEEEAK
ncbi:MAG: peptidylprolyl isomerase, partial [Oxalobacter sp.]|nr:peptidylprolyl isomerase [Oxalobacter sp.]